jgi:hypothetical protein
LGLPSKSPPSGSTPSINRKVSLQLENVPLSELLNYIVQQTNLQFTVYDYAVYLRPRDVDDEALTVRIFLVPPGFLNIKIPPKPNDSVSYMFTVILVNKQLTDRGILFPEGATANFLPDSRKLVVRDTPEQLDLIAKYIEELSGPKKPPTPNPAPSTLTP